MYTTGLSGVVIRNITLDSTYVQFGNTFCIFF